MKNLLGAAAFAAAFLFAQSALALIIEARLDSFEPTPVNIAGVGTGGGRGTFTLLGTSEPVAGSLADILDASFQAICLEPDSFVTTGQTYAFSVVDLAFAPTNGVPGGMGAAREAAVEDAFGRRGVTTVEALDLTGVSTSTVTAYEAGYEALGNPLDVTSGTAIVSGVGAGAAQLSLDDGGPFSELLTKVNAFALINLGPTGGFSTRAVFEGQDFMVTTAEAVPEPGVLALMGLGMLGLVRTARRAA